MEGVALSSKDTVLHGETSKIVVIDLGNGVKLLSINALRERLLEDTTFYVRAADGSDANNGKTNNSGGAFLTLQHALDHIVTLDFNQYVVTIRLVGDFTGQALLASLNSHWIGGSRDALVIEGDEADKTAVTINSIEFNCHTPNRITIQHLAIKGYLVSWEGTFVEPRDLHFLNATSGSFSGGCGIWQQDAGCKMQTFGAWSIAEGATFQIVQWVPGAYLQWSTTSVTALGAGCNVNPFVYACGIVVAFVQTTFTGTFTGIRWKIDDNGFINLGGRTGGLTFWPGTTAGVFRDHGKYAYGRTVVEGKLYGVDSATETFDFKTTIIKGGRKSVDTKTASHTAALADIGRTIHMNVASANDFTIPPNTTTAFPLHAAIEVVQTGAGQTTFVQGSGVTINSEDGNKKIRARYGAAVIYQESTDVWILVGSLAA
jgi:hypothetical protein